VPDCANHKAVEAEIRNIKEDVVALETGMSNMSSFVSGLDKTLAKHDELIKKSFERIEKTENLTDAINEVTTEIRISNKNQEKILEALKTSQEDHDARLKVVEQMPANDALVRQKLVITVVITSLTSGAVGFVLSNFSR